MKDKRKIAWLVIGGVVILGLVSNSIGKKMEPAKQSNFWSSVSSTDTFTEKTLQSGSADKIAIIRIEGVLTDSSEQATSILSGSGSGATAEQIVKQIDQAEKDTNIRALILQINSPGGTAVAGQTVLERLAKFKDSGKKLYVAMREVAASAAYEISLPADKIFANQETETGSIGVIMQMPDYTGLYSKVGVSTITIKSGDKKDMGNPARTMTSDEKSILQVLVDESYNNFVAAVAKWRKIDDARVREIGDGRIYTAKQAKELGLIDEIANLPAIIDYAKSESGAKDPSVVQYQAGPLGGLLSSIFQKASLGSQLSSILGQEDLSPNNQLMHLWMPQ